MSDIWFTEYSFNKTMGLTYQVSETLHDEQSQFQRIQVLNTDCVGKLLLLDGKAMVSDVDEFVYHEVVSHIPYMALEKVENVLVVGGGDGGAVREFAKHSDIKRIDLVEIDERVIEVSKQYFPDVASGLTDPRVRVLATDGIEYMKSIVNEYDIVVIDSTDPENFAEGLFTEEFYRSVNRAMTEKSIMINQTENPFFDEYGIGKIYQNLRSAFPSVKSFAAPMAIYPGVYWTFGVSSKGVNPREIVQSKKTYMEELEKSLRWYNQDWHQACFSLPNIHKQKLGMEN